MCGSGGDGRGRVVGLVCSVVARAVARCGNVSLLQAKTKSETETLCCSYDSG